MKHFILILMILIIGCADKPAETAQAMTEAAITEALVATAVTASEVAPVVVAANETIAHIYVVKPGDWLSTIALSQLGNIDDWRKIHRWNYARLASAHVIFPYDEIVLHKLVGTGIKYRYGFNDYIVRAGDTLWAIAARVYGDNYAWVVLMRDNMKYMSYGPRRLVIGQRLIVRSSL